MDAQHTVVDLKLLIHGQSYKKSTAGNHFFSVLETESQSVNFSVKLTHSTHTIFSNKELCREKIGSSQIQGCKHKSLAGSCGL